jgi:hypothetical protein
MRFPVQNLTWAQIKALARPQNPTEPEAVPAVLFDTLAYTSAATTTLKFFQQPSNDPTLTNVNTGRLPQDNAFRIAAFGCDILIPVAISTANTAPGALSDMALLLKSGRPIFQFKTSQKDYGNVPLTFAHASGGETGFFAATLTAPAHIDYANNGVFDGGFFTDNNLWVIPNTAFEVNVTWSAAQTLATGNPLIRFWMAGTLYRPVL